MAADATPGVTLTAGGRAHSGWKTLAVQRSMEQCAGGFRLGVSELWSGQQVARAIKPTDECELLIDGETVIRGYVDEVELAIDAGEHSVEVTGRDATADLVDCSAAARTGQWRGQRIEQIAAELARPFSITVKTEVDTGKPLTSFALQEGETVFDAISRAARIRALLLVPDGKGGLLITRAGTERIATPLVLGNNILQARVRVDMRDRYSVYVLKGQAPGSDFLHGQAVAQIAAKARDGGVLRFRPLIITADCPDLAVSLQERTIWEANVRAARSLVVDVTVQGWQHADGLWAPNRLVKVSADVLRLDAELLIVSAEFRLDARGGSTTRLTLTRPDAFSLLPIKSLTGAGPYWDR